MRSLLILVLFCAAIIICGAPDGFADTSTATTSARNVLLLISDDQGLDAGCYGNTAVRTPNIDSLAAAGMRFTEAYAVVSSCSPSRSTILTGLYNHANGQYGLAHAEHNQRTRPQVRSLPAILREKGYFTGIVGKNHVEPEQVYPFEVHDPSANRHPVALAKSTRKFLQAAGEKPFFLVVGFGDTHRAGSSFPRSTRATTISKNANYKLPEFLTDLPEVRADYEDYLASVNNLDRCVGAVLDELTSAGKRESTLVIFVSDNGIPFPGAKTNLYDAGIRLPMIVDRPADGMTSHTTAAMVSWVDIAPTILDWAGAGGADKMQGRSVLPLLDKPDAAGWDHVFASHTFHEITMYYPMRCLRTREYKLIWNIAHQLEYRFAEDIAGSKSWKAMSADPLKRVGGRTIDQTLHRPQFELYDVRSDPGETKNLASDSGQADVLSRLKGEMLTIMKRTKDPWAVVFPGAKAQ